MIARIVWFAALAAIALGTAALQLDWQSRRSPELAAFVPEPVRANAQVQIARQALAGEDAARAVAEAEQLVRRRPIPAQHLVMLATSQVKAGQAEQAGRTVQIAGQRGWREPAAQEANLRMALAAGDKAEAARRYAALFLRSGTPDSLLLDLGPAVLGEPGGIGQQTMVAIVSDAERWHSLFLRRGLQVMPPEAFAAIAAQSLAKGAAFDCNVLATAIDSLARGHADAADSLRAAAGRCADL